MGLQDQSHITCYLAGYVVECAGKAIVMSYFQTTPLDVSKEFSHDTKKIDESLRYIALNGPPANIPPGCWPEFDVDAPTILKGQHKWHPQKRYQDNCGWDSTRRALFLSEARSVMQKMAQLRASSII